VSEIGPKSTLIILTPLLEIEVSEVDDISNYLPWKNKYKCNGVMHANVGFFRANVMVMCENVMHCFE
jgi:hypothetical protein